eukprot:scaffold112517_cov18-Tisochrysis_lutea.AAC.1
MGECDLGVKPLHLKARQLHEWALNGSPRQQGQVNKKGSQKCNGIIMVALKYSCPRPQQVHGLTKRLTMVKSVSQGKHVDAQLHAARLRGGSHQLTRSAARLERKNKCEVVRGERFGLRYTRLHAARSWHVYFALGCGWDAHAVRPGLAGIAKCKRRIVAACSQGAAMCSSCSVLAGMHALRSALAENLNIALWLLAVRELACVHCALFWLEGKHCTLLWLEFKLCAAAACNKGASM